MNGTTVLWLDAALSFGIPLLLILIAYIVGSLIERRHFRSIRLREEALREYPLSTFATLPVGWQVGESQLVTAGIVISLDYFKRIIAGLRGLVGGRIKTYEPLLDRARREAVLRVAEKARAAGFDAVINLRLETSRLANARSQGKGTAGVEMLAFGTAITLTRR